MESLFDDNFVNKKPLRKYEPLIRFDVDGTPQPRRLIDRSGFDNQSLNGIKSKFDEKQSDDSAKKSGIIKDGDMKSTSNVTTTSSIKPNVISKLHEPTEDLKRKFPHPSSRGVEPVRKKLQPTQKSITCFFTKK